ncbi:MAG: hypothetical protein IMF12_11410 [Proteobacteria bacterium]|nr:hypothetical protein [Pseudomonadota bacterium]
MCEKIKTKIQLLCPNKKCSYYQDLANKITTDSVYTIKSDSISRQMLKYHGGNHRFSETRYSDLFGKQGSFYEYEMVAKMCSCSLSSGQIAYIIGRDVRTIEQWDYPFIQSISHQIYQNITPNS